MSYISYQFFLFLGAVLLGYTVTPSKYKWCVLLAGSAVFYWMNSRWLTVFLLCTTIAVYAAARMLDSMEEGFSLAKGHLEREDKKRLKALVAGQKRGVVICGLAVAVGLLLWLKYGAFFAGCWQHLPHHWRLPQPPVKTRMFLPLGISYYTLQAAGYLIDVSRGKCKACRNFAKLALFLTFFPQITEGPIGRYDRLSAPLFEGHPFEYERFTKGLQRIVFGLFKKLVIADRVNLFVSAVFEESGTAPGGILLLAGILYTLQIYAEFSGCMDIVIGCAELFGIPMDENFARPFFAKSVSEFWRRWHITLGAWFKDYVFYSISLSKPFMRLSKFVRRRGNDFLGAVLPAAMALFFTWLGTGFWHGAAWKYAAYGLYYYLIMLAGMLLEPLFAKVCGSLHIHRQGRAFSLFAMGRTALAVVGGMLLFRAESVSEWGTILAGIFGRFSLRETLASVLRYDMDRKDFAVIAVGVVILLVIGILQEKGIHVREAIARRPLPVRWALYLALVMAVIVFGAYGRGYEAVDFIYGQF